MPLLPMPLLPLPLPLPSLGALLTEGDKEGTSEGDSDGAELKEGDKEGTPEGDPEGAELEEGAIEGASEQKKDYQIETKINESEKSSVRLRKTKICFIILHIPVPQKCCPFLCYPLT